MTAKKLWQEGLKKLKGLSDSASLDSLLLVCSALNIDKESYWKEPEQKVNQKQKDTFFYLLAQRCQKKPMAYLLKEKEFWGHGFFVDERVLIPRAETEILVEVAINLLRKQDKIYHVFDVGTGSGAVGISIGMQLKDRVCLELIDISAQALEVACINQQALNYVVSKMHCCHLLTCYKMLPDYSLVLANLPYLNENECCIKEKNYPHEPLLALYGGPDEGLTLIKELLDQIKDKYSKKAWVVLEASSWQMPLIWHRMEELSFNEIKIYKDLAGQDRVISACL